MTWYKIDGTSHEYCKESDIFELGNSGVKYITKTLTGRYKVVWLDGTFCDQAVAILDKDFIQISKKLNCYSSPLFNKLKNDKRIKRIPQDEVKTYDF